MSSRQGVEQRQQKQKRELEAEILASRQLQRKRGLVEGDHVFAPRGPPVGYPPVVQRESQQRSLVLPRQPAIVGEIVSLDLKWL